MRIEAAVFACVLCGGCWDEGAIEEHFQRCSVAVAMPQACFDDEEAQHTAFAITIGRDWSPGMQSCIEDVPCDTVDDKQVAVTRLEHCLGHDETPSACVIDCEERELIECDTGGDCGAAAVTTCFSANDACVAGCQ
jgi:hypothetical protein